MKFHLQLLTITSLALITSACIGNGDIKVTGNKVVEKADVSVGGVHVTINNNEVEQLEKEKTDIGKELEDVRTQLTAKDKLLTDEVKKLQDQVVTLLEREQKVTERLVALRQNDANLRSQLTQLQNKIAEERVTQDELNQLRDELERERAARKAAEQRAQKAEEEATTPATEEITWSGTVIENHTRCSVGFSILSDTGVWESWTLAPGNQLIYRKHGAGIQVRFGSQTRLIESTPFSSEPADSALLNRPVNYFDWDDDGNLELFYDE